MHLDPRCAQFPPEMTIHRYLRAGRAPAMACYDSGSPDLCLNPRCGELAGGRAATCGGRRPGIGRSGGTWPRGSPRRHTALRPDVLSTCTHVCALFPLGARGARLHGKKVAVRCPGRSLGRGASPACSGRSVVVTMVCDRSCARWALVLVGSLSSPGRLVGARCALLAWLLAIPVQGHALSPRFASHPPPRRLNSHKRCSCMGGIAGDQRLFS